MGSRIGVTHGEMALDLLRKLDPQVHGAGWIAPWGAEGAGGCGCKAALHHPSAVLANWGCVPNVSKNRLDAVLRDMI